MTADHITVNDRTVRAIDAICRKCGAQAHIGQYDKPERADQAIEQWLARHEHKA